MSTETEKAAPAATPAPVTCGRSYDCGEPSGFALFVGRFAIFFALVAIVFYGLGYLFRGGSSVETPDFDDFGQDLIKNMRQAQEEEDVRAESPEMKELREKWQGKFSKGFVRLMTKIEGKIDADAKEIERHTKEFIDPVLNNAFGLNPYGMDESDLEDLRDDYMDGAYDCFDSFCDFFAKNTKELGSDPVKYWEPVLRSYNAQFKASVEKAAKDKKDTDEKDAERARIVTNAMFLLVFAAMIPLLAKIERNTRRG